MASTELAHTDPDEIPEEDSIALTERQIQALEKLNELGAEPRQTPNEPYSPDNQIRAFQMIYEGKIGGPGRGQGRKRQPRASQEVAEHVRSVAKKMNDVIDDALVDENIRVRLAAVDLALGIERDETKLDMDEEKHEADLNSMDKDGLVAEFIALASSPAAQAALGGFVNGSAEEEPHEEISEAVVVTEADDEAVSSEDPEIATVDDKSTGHNRGKPQSNGRGRSAGHGKKDANPFSPAAKRRARERRRATRMG